MRVCATSAACPRIYCWSTEGTADKKYRGKVALRSQVEAVAGRCHRVDASTRTIGPTPNEAVAALRPADSLAEIRNDARRERLLDMQVRLRPYRTACFAILVLALVSVSAEVGWWWVAPLAVGFAGLAIADRFMQRSSRPELWAAASWGMLSLLLADAVVITGGGDSPVLMWFALPAVTLGARFSPRGMALGTVYILGLLLLSTYGLDPTTAAANHQSRIAAAALTASALGRSRPPAQS